jgi:carbamoyl-phosphate synthase large subunit
MMNVLLTCAGRRNYLVSYFKAALAGKGMVLAGDLSADSPALQDADAAFLLPSIDHPEYIDALVSVCRRHDVRLVLSLNDLELPIVAAHADRFARVGATLVTASPDVIAACSDKWRTFELLTRHGIPTARTYCSLEEATAALDARELSFPLVIKPRWGSASIGVHIVEDREELRIMVGVARRQLARSLLARQGDGDAEHVILIQERLTGHEHGLDVVNDLEGRHRATFAKRKLAMRSGETDKAVTVASAALEELGARLGQTLKHLGVLDCDVMDDGLQCRVIEMNPRFGGGYPFSHVAGANVPAALLAWARGEEAHPDWLRIRAGVVAAKCDRLVLIEPLTPQPYQ